MTQKDYIAIAQVIKEVYEIEEEWGPDYYAALSLVVGRLTSVLKKDNPRFDITKFEKACGVIE